VDRPIYFEFEPRDPLPPSWNNWFAVVQDCGAKNSTTSAAASVDRDYLTLRTGPNARLTPVEVLVRRIPGGFVIRWRYAGVPRVGRRQRFLGRGEDVNRFRLSFTRSFPPSSCASTAKLASGVSVPWPPEPEAEYNVVRMGAARFELATFTVSG
jgi:hypothetical protein